MTAELASTDAVDRRHRRLARVRFLRRALPAAAGVLMLTVVGQVTWRGIRLVMIPEAPPPASGVRMVNPVFTGESRDGSRYRVTARMGTRADGETLRIALDQPTVNVTAAGGSATNTTAAHGVFREDDMTLQLDGNVQVRDDSGNRLSFRNAVFDTRTGRLSGRGVQSEVRGAEVRSEQYTADEKAGRMVFKGQVRGRIDGQ